MKRTYVGFAVGSSTCHVAALDNEGRSVRNLQFPTSEATLRRQSPAYQARYRYTLRLQSWRAGSGGSSPGVWRGW
jgi:hypothetical protein